MPTPTTFTQPMITTLQRARATDTSNRNMAEALLSLFLSATGLQAEAMEWLSQRPTCESGAKGGRLWLMPDNSMVFQIWEGCFTTSMPTGREGYDPVATLFGTTKVR